MGLMMAPLETLQHVHLTEENMIMDEFRDVTVQTDNAALFKVETV